MEVGRPVTPLVYNGSMSDSADDIAVPETASPPPLVDGGHAVRPCSWCAADVPQVRRPGRPRLYCRQACRQRAYEHRHGLCHQRTERELPGQDGVTRPPFAGSRSGYERGGSIARIGGRLHALRPSVRPDGGRRETLCGLLVPPNPGRWFQEYDRHACLSCVSIAQNFPLRFVVQPSNELARLRAVIDEAAESRVDPVAAIRWLQSNAPDHRHPRRPPRPPTPAAA